MAIKEKLEIIQSIVTIFAVLVGGFWTYTLFVKERENYPHATIEHAPSHIALSKDINLLRVSMTVKNTGTSILEIKEMFIRVQQILPVPLCADTQPCAADQVNKALRGGGKKRGPVFLAVDQRENQALGYLSRDRAH
jgi:hypothetical protein